MKIRSLILLFILLGFVQQSQAQPWKKLLKWSKRDKSTLIQTSRIGTVYSSWELGVNYGESHYNGDLSKNFFQVVNMNQALGAFVRYQHTRYWAYRISYTKGTLSASDANNKTSLRYRNLSFTSPLQELSLVVESHIPEFSVCKNFNWSGYVFAGIAGFKFRPSNQYGDLQSLHTEGQGTSSNPNLKPYKLTQIAIPFGIGIKFVPLRPIVIGAEIGFRKTFTDYIDDVSTRYPDAKVLAEEVGANAVAAAFSGYGGSNPQSKKSFQRGNPQFKDAYWIAQLSLSYCFLYDCRSERHRFNDVGGCKSF
ncbi:MAG: DUF6089 family protein [Chitinophagales bacterium]|nr:DUF6089 family protein [Chitinophagales bacterium]